jgi:hypothetical protein
MTRCFLATAALIASLSAAPAAAVDRPGLANATAGANVTVHRGGPGPFVAPYRDRDRFDRRGNRGFDGGLYLGDREYQGDTAWRPTGFNDWWHERPQRSEPRWLQSNNCERQYWTGSGWRC